MVMTDRNEALVREAYEAYGRGDVARMMEFVDPELEWTYLNPAFENPEPETCHGRDQLQWALERQAEQGLASQVEEIVSSARVGQRAHAARPATRRGASPVAGTGAGHRGLPRRLRRGQATVPAAGVAGHLLRLAR
jgi:ketosteroid isomerase-like protein